ncbi:Hypothetical predicted protein [Lecanosticta acicola]|uniref:DUF1308 domain-containing protein n=1 Tax=Lecanosticta acicola TaxID=111012 RepID=A0AAI8YRS2_9PEZI|nr:Hypothetical predicted protein [Lecanosticta acicola]
MATQETDQEDVSQSVLPVLKDLTDRAKTLLSELETFRAHLRTIRQEGQVEIASFRSTVQSELGMLERLSSKPDNASTSHIARSSNLPFLETVWNEAKKSKRVAALQKRVYYNSPSKSLSQAMTMRHVTRQKPNKEGMKNAAVPVDAITDSGLTWLKVSLVTNTRLLFDLAKQGWQSGGSEDEEGPAFPSEDDDDDDIPLVKSAKEICYAAQSFRIRTRTPVVHLILPRVQPGETDEVDGILDQCRAAGALVFCGEDLKPSVPIDQALDVMASNPISTFSETVNIDCTILLALVSEFSHARVSKEPWFHRALQRQVEIEGNENLLPSLLYPALANHPMVCTSKAAKRMSEIVETIGTPSEKARTAILLADEKLKSHHELVQEMQAWSAYEVPDSWRLPIRILDQDEETAMYPNLPPAATAASESMTSINKSVFLYGWATGVTTITSNRTVVKQLESDLDKHESLDDATWPSIWLCPTARSLVGKEKRGVKKEHNKKDGVYSLPDPLRREAQRRNGLDVLSAREGREVVDLRPDGYPCEEVLEAKNAARQASSAPLEAREK